MKKKKEESAIFSRNLLHITYISHSFRHHVHISGKAEELEFEEWIKLNGEEKKSHNWVYETGFCYCFFFVCYPLIFLSSLLSSYSHMQLMLRYDIWLRASSIYVQLIFPFFISFLQVTIGSQERASCTIDKYSTGRVLVFFVAAYQFVCV